ncbi:sugar transferase [Albidovulum sediminis]|uniref:Sugar transferase n=1 Tax=Albidovulum sediminis TaxID=3066345 RepID=A0ABT2NP58_9RHOB|nr:sugar transferase [Defluviimonas sediminis]MCT8330669.1 sugar transferase [Defluviimonas sediminis]
MTKRLFDVGLAIALLPFLLPVMAAIAVVVLVCDGRPVLHAGERMQTCDRGFLLWKFRTMRPGSADGVATGGDKNGRVTRLGRVLRRTRLDEMPQLFHILSGRMSFVGPRPPLRRYVELHPEIFAEVLQSRPGVTGLATVRFHAHESRLMARCRTALESDGVYRRRCLPAKARLDRLYARKRHLGLDLLILAWTIRAVLPGRTRGT